jgi:hypothetical protein
MLATCNSSKLFEIVDLSCNNNKSEREISSNIDHNTVVMTNEGVLNATKHKCNERHCQGGLLRILWTSGLNFGIQWPNCFTKVATRDFYFINKVTPITSKVIDCWQFQPNLMVWNKPRWLNCPILPRQNAKFCQNKEHWVWESKVGDCLVRKTPSWRALEVAKFSSRKHNKEEMEKGRTELLN